jgi:carbamoyl-phosphate synthase large subunit
VLAQNGKSLVTIPFKRVKPKEGVSLVSEIDMNSNIIKYVEDIVELFGLDWVVNIQLKISADGEPLVYEINPRLAGSVILTKGAGCNLLEYGLDILTGKEIQISAPQYSKMIRYYTEILT